MFLTRISVTHPVFATMMMVALLVMGAFSLQRLGQDQYPNVDVPVVVVITTYPGATPETVETEITRPVEDALNTLGGLDEVTSTSYEGRSVVVAKFKLEVQSSAAAQEVRDKIAAIEANFPEDARKPVISRFDPAADPILSVAISSTSLDVTALTSLADQRVVRQLTTVAGVGQATLVGARKRQIDVTIDETRMRALGIGVNEVVNALRSGNSNSPAGSVVDPVSERTIQVQGRIEEPQALLDMVVARRGGAAIELRDIATLAEGAADPESRALYNGQTALAIDIVKVQDANTVQVVSDVRKRLDALNAELAPQNVRLRIVTDSSIPIRESVTQVQTTLVEGAALAVAIVFLFLNSWRSTVITGLTLPIAIVGTLAVIDFLGFTLNTLSLLALTLSIGILVDDAIVVRENITRHLHMGKSHLRAALDGTSEIGLAVIATTATIVAVFLPVAFMDGIVGRFFYEFGVTVSAAVLISLFVAFTLDPMLSSVWYDPDAQADAKRGPVGRLVARFDRGFEWMAGRYRRAIGWTLRHRLVTLLATSGIFVGSLLMVPLVGTEFVPNADEGRFQINMTAPVGSSLDYTTTKVRQIEKALREFPEVETLYSTVNTGGAAGKHRAAIMVELVPLNMRSRTPLALAEPVRKRLSAIPGVEIAILQNGLGGGESPVQIGILGDDRSVLEKIANGLMEDMKKIPGLVDVTSSARDVTSILSVRLKPAAASDLGIARSDLAAALSPLIGGEDVSKWTDADGNSYDIVIRLPAERRSDATRLGELMIATGRTATNGAPLMVRLDQVADIGAMPAPAEIRRIDNRREILVSANITGRTLGDVTETLQALTAGRDLPNGYRIRFGGEAETMQETIGHLVTALTMAVIFIYIVLASQFGSFTQPLAIMASLPLSLIGVLVGLMAAGSTINMFSLIGFIMLMGLVTKNGILLVDFANRERRRGLSLNEALENAGVIRFRPIIMTTLAMIFGMIPLGLAVGGGGAQRAPMAHAVVGGLVSSTLLTLIVVPTILSYMDSIVRRFARLLPKAPDEAEHPEPPVQPAPGHPG
ncbi:MULTISPECIES: efflux RND transporter permease subunit [unclassified Agrobacterium]|uniref:efflux RND transporter permease subunit n=1 Tax=unclassified Agrobacterium TaxID=2632611 RepID=UPI00244B8B36|nr:MULTISPECIES: efflux RND transporter permease subunit [unclassified Agrobacterium]MDH0616394.1 efflux RND transporter permease subunit [Agrobacterium sp. GD03872]MDH0699010.1 efflux RND transporter permease subunit [Agrobacterium sp. GD03871]MDH1061624.1 efflux RND transporter permease subunit [Agrobacterium sp. GD03992]MDH2213196.1 efflux RND transporter permease subunit [Agrobacterium sp. GD03643]MDH2221867.1 efflux RND transporter permease subunit [Agrobacterium sp. GD03638]